MTPLTVPLVAVFTKFDGQIIDECAKLADTKDDNNWERARKNAEDVFQTVYLPKVMGTQYPPKGYVRLEGNNCEHSYTPNGNNVVNRYGFGRE